MVERKIQKVALLLYESNLPHHDMSSNVTMKDFFYYSISQDQNWKVWRLDSFKTSISLFTLVLVALLTWLFFAMKNNPNYYHNFQESSWTMMVTICQFPPSLTEICENLQVNSIGYLSYCTVPKDKVNIVRSLAMLIKPARFCLKAWHVMNIYKQIC